jgi:MFS family permease
VGLQWVLSAYAITVAGLLLLGGRAADLLGRRRVFMVGVAFFTAASLFCGLAWSPAALLAGRALQGVGAAIMTPTALSIISTTFPEGSERNKALGIWGGMGGIGASAGWLIGGPLVDGPGWEWIFFINIPLGLAALALTPVLLHESRAALSRRSYDLAGAVTITGALVLLVYAVVEAPDTGWGDMRTILLFAGSAVLLSAFAQGSSVGGRAPGAGFFFPHPMVELGLARRAMSKITTAPAVISRPTHEHPQAGPDRPVELDPGVGLDVDAPACVGIHHDRAPATELGIPGELLLAGAQRRPAEQAPGFLPPLPRDLNPGSGDPTR